ncbi:MAG: DNA-binding protein [Phycisphaerae bacterium]|nr:DNA-binding protein [Phycisphaerae bacterium]
MTHALFVAWRSSTPTGGEWGPVGRLEYDGVYRFGYTRGAQRLGGFAPFPGMPNLESVYESDELLPLFANRLLARSRPEYEAFLTWGGFDPDNPPDPIAILGVTEGRRATDDLELFPCPVPDADGCYVSKFFLHGVRYVPEPARKRIDELASEETLGLMLDISNPYDRHAVAVRTWNTQGRYLIGYVPRYLARDIRQLCGRCDPDFVSLTVERVNPGAPLQQRVLCRMTCCWPSGFRPCNGDDFEPIVTTRLTTAP